MSAFSKGIIVAVLHLLIVLGLGGKLLYDRAYRPRVWVKTGSVDPDLPIRGRYFTLRVQVKAPWFHPNDEARLNDVELSVQNGELVASKVDFSTGLSISSWMQRIWSRSTPQEIFLDQGVPFFIPEHAEIPRANTTGELWAEVTIPKKGPPRPIQLALKDQSGWHPLNLH